MAGGGDEKGASPASSAGAGAASPGKAASPYLAGAERWGGGSPGGGAMAGYAAAYGAAPVTDSKQAWAAEKKLERAKGSVYAAARREADDLRRQLARLTRSYNAVVAKEDEVRAEMGALNRGNAAKEKQVAQLRRVLERLGEERRAAESERTQDKAYIRKLELKLSAASAPLDLKERHQELKKKAQGWRAEVQGLEAQLSVFHGSLQDKALEIQALKTALDTKAAEISKELGASVSSQMLYGLARSREEGIALAIQLSELKDAKQALEEQTAELHDKLKHRELEAMEHRSRLFDLEKQVHMAEAEKLQHQQGAVNLSQLLKEREKVLDALQRTNVGLEAAKAQAQARAAHLEEALSETDRATKKLNDQLYSDIIGTMEKEAQRLAEERAQFQEREGALEKHVALLQSKLEHYDEDHQRAARQAEQAAKEQFAVREKELLGEIGNLGSEIEALAELNERLQLEVQGGDQRSTAEQRRSQNLAKQVQALEGALKEVRRGKHQAEAALKGKLEAALGDYSLLVQEKDALKQQAQDLLSTKASLEAQNSHLRDEMTNLSSSNDNLSSAKARLQGAMLDEVADVKAQLDKMLLANGDLERTVLAYQENEQRLELLIENERQTSHQLMQNYLDPSRAEAQRPPAQDAAIQTEMVNAMQGLKKLRNFFNEDDDTDTATTTATTAATAAPGGGSASPAKRRAASPAGSVDSGSDSSLSEILRGPGK